MFSGILEIANTEETIAFILGHEMAHALLDHSRTSASKQNVKNGLTTAARIGGLGLALFGLGEVGMLAFDAANIADIGSELLILQPHGRDQELEADQLGIRIINWAGYNIKGIPDFWTRMSNSNANNFDFFSTHPSDDKRIQAMKEIIDKIENEDSNTQYLENSSICSNCGSTVIEGDLFCRNCGVKIEKENKKNKNMS